MGLFDKLRGKREPDVWEDAVKMAPRLYRSQDDGHHIGMFMLREGGKTMLPRSPQDLYQAGEEEIEDWRLLLVSLTTQDLVATLDYFEALELIEPDALATDANFVLTPACTTAQLRDLAARSRTAQ